MTGDKKALKADDGHDISVRPDHEGAEVSTTNAKSSKDEKAVKEDDVLKSQPIWRYGKLGKFFGSGPYAVSNVASLILIVLVLYLGIIIVDALYRESVSNFVALSTPVLNIVTLILLYLLGAKRD